MHTHLYINMRYLRYFDFPPSFPPKKTAQFWRTLHLRLCRKRSWPSCIVCVSFCLFAHEPRIIGRTCRKSKDAMKEQRSNARAKMQRKSKDAMKEQRCNE